jgi:RNA polymerase sigma factor (sigma-70 family)
VTGEGRPGSAEAPRGHLWALGDEEPVGATGARDELAAFAAERDFVAVYEEHYPRVVRALELGGLVRQEAEDVAQEAFARTLVRWRRVRRGTNPPGYVFRVAFRLARRRPPAPLEVAAEASAPDDAVVAILRTDLFAALSAMPIARRRCAVLCLLAGCSPKETGRALGIAESTVRKQLELARRDLRASLG